MAEALTPIRRAILEYIAAHQKERNFPPTIREIGAAVGLKSPATIKNHIDVLKGTGHITADPQKPRTLMVKLDENAIIELDTIRGIRNIPLIGDVAAGTGVLAAETQGEFMALPEEFAGRGESFVLKVRGESMIDAAILPGDFVVVSRQVTANKGEIVVAGIPGEEATVKRYFPQGSRVILQPENATMEPMEFDANDVVIYGKVISVLRNY
ncbi:MAG: transcriptional repressor LexA [Actinomycetes bacterium]